MAKGEFPYPIESLRSIFGLIKLIVKGDPPRLTDERFSEDLKEFVALWCVLVNEMICV